ncbi:MAG: zinc-ribbon domain-containing protein [Ruminococcus sp.]|nr:zinc-ribbon domain-containing protein [Ruminococcus sp.]
MKCPNCSHKIPNEAAFCTHCGVPVTTQDNLSHTAPAADKKQSKTKGKPSQKKPFNLKKFLLITIPSVLLVLLIALNFNGILGFVLKHFASPKLYMGYVITNHFKDSDSSDFVTAYDEMIADLTYEGASSSSTTGSVTDMGLDVISALMDSYFGDSNMGSMLELFDLSLIKDFSYDSEVNFKDDIYSSHSKIQIGELMSSETDTIYDINTNTLYKAHPDKTETFIMVEPEKDLDMTIPQGMDIKQGEIKELITDLKENLPSGEELLELLGDSGRNIYDAIDKIEKSKDKIVIEDKEQKVTVLTLSMDKAMVEEICDILYEGLNKDEGFKALTDKYNDRINTIYTSATGSENTLSQDIRNMIAENFSEISLLVDGKHQIAGLRVGHNGSVNFEYMAGNEETPSMYNMELDSQLGTISASCQDTQKTLGGVCNVSSGDEVLLSVEVEDFDKEQYSADEPSGSVTLTIGKSLYDNGQLPDILNLVKLRLKFDFIPDDNPDSTEIVTSLLANSSELAQATTVSTKAEPKATKLPEEYMTYDQVDSWKEQNKNAEQQGEDSEESNESNSESSEESSGNAIGGFLGDLFSSSIDNAIDDTIDQVLENLKQEALGYLRDKGVPEWMIVIIDL